MPFEAAKAIAATFCYEIRYVLTPIFGPDFPDSCILPEDPIFQRPAIDADIVRQCTEEAASQQEQSLSASTSSTPRLAPRRLISSKLTPSSMRSTTTTDDDGPWSTNDESEPPQTPRSHLSDLWNPVNGSRSSKQSKYPQLVTPRGTPELAEPELKSHRSELRTRKRAVRKGSQDQDSDSMSSPSMGKRKKESHRSPTSGATSMPSVKPSPREMLAALALLELHKADKQMGERVRAMSRSASG